MLNPLSNKVMLATAVYNYKNLNIPFCKQEFVAIKNNRYKLQARPSKLREIKAQERNMPIIIHKKRTKTRKRLKKQPLHTSVQKTKCTANAQSQVRKRRRVKRKTRPFLKPQRNCLNTHLMKRNCNCPFNTNSKEYNNFNRLIKLESQYEISCSNGNTSKIVRNIFQYAPQNNDVPFIWEKHLQEVMDSSNLAKIYNIDYYNKKKNKYNQVDHMNLNEIDRILNMIEKRKTLNKSEDCSLVNFLRGVAELNYDDKIDLFDIFNKRRTLTPYVINYLKKFALDPCVNLEPSEVAEIFRVLRLAYKDRSIEYLSFEKSLAPRYANKKISLLYSPLLDQCKDIKLSPKNNLFGDGSKLLDFLHKFENMDINLNQLYDMNMDLTEITRLIRLLYNGEADGDSDNDKSRKSRKSRNGRNGSRGTKGSRGSRGSNVNTDGRGSKSKKYKRWSGDDGKNTKTGTGIKGNINPSISTSIYTKTDKSSLRNTSTNGGNRKSNQQRSYRRMSNTIPRSLKRDTIATSNRPYTLQSFRKSTISKYKPPIRVVPYKKKTFIRSFYFTKDR